MAWEYETFIDKAGQWRWHLRAANGRIVATSGEAFASEQHAERAARNVKANAGSAELQFDAAVLAFNALFRAARRSNVERRMRNARYFASLNRQ